MIDKNKDIMQEVNEIISQSQMIEHEIAENQTNCENIMRFTRNMYDAGLKVGFNQEQSFALTYASFMSQLNSLKGPL